MVKGTLRKGSFAKVTGDRRDAATSGDINRPPEYMEQLPLHVMAIADPVLVVEGQELLVHKYVLAVNSPVFGELFETEHASESGTETTTVIPRFPLQGANIQDVCTALKYCYQGSLLVNPGRPVLQSVEDAARLVRFAHKYALKGLLDEAEKYLVSRATLEDGKVLFKDQKCLVKWVALAESCRLSTFLAHAQLFMIKQAGYQWWQDLRLLLKGSDSISQDCIFRVLQGAQCFRGKVYQFMDTNPSDFAYCRGCRNYPSSCKCSDPIILNNNGVTIAMLQQWHNTSL